MIVLYFLILFPSATSFIAKSHEFDYLLLRKMDQQDDTKKVEILVQKSLKKLRGKCDKSGNCTNGSFSKASNSSPSYTTRLSIRRDEVTEFKIDQDFVSQVAISKSALSAGLSVYIKKIVFKYKSIRSNKIEKETFSTKNHEGLAKLPEGKLSHTWNLSKALTFSLKEIGSKVIMEVHASYFSSDNEKSNESDKSNSFWSGLSFNDITDKVKIVGSRIWKASFRIDIYSPKFQWTNYKYLGMALESNNYEIQLKYLKSKGFHEYELPPKKLPSTSINQDLFQNIIGGTPSSLMQKAKEYLNQKPPLFSLKNKWKRGGAAAYVDMAKEKIESATGMTGSSIEEAVAAGVKGNGNEDWVSLADNLHSRIMYLQTQYILNDIKLDPKNSQWKGNYKKSKKYKLKAVESWISRILDIFINSKVENKGLNSLMKKMAKQNFKEYKSKYYK
ncbi:MAG: hypothetical protein COB02_09735 [Candidatus Cloacimonadota bacterium]|nr:MAG: hypothetical protein COB02_09735 [Candidatus Cloacimonadota bacterium]